MSTQSISEIINNRVTIAGVELRIDTSKTVRGSNHAVYYFQDEKLVTFEGQAPVSAQEIVLRKVSQLVTPARSKKPTNIVNETEQAYLDLQGKNIAVPKKYLATDKGWVLERIPEKVDPDLWKEALSINELRPREKVILVFAKQILLKSAYAHQSHEPEFVGDFYPRNVMLNHDDVPHVVDFARCQKSRLNLFDQLRTWANKNRVVFDYLIEAFPESFKQEMVEKWEENILK
jgi:hypothetical protein